MITGTEEDATSRRKAWISRPSIRISQSAISTCIHDAHIPTIQHLSDKSNFCLILDKLEERTAYTATTTLLGMILNNFS